MPFDPATGAWYSGNDKPWNMPSTSAGDIIGGFQSYDTYQQNQEARDLENMLSQFTLEKGQYGLERQKADDSQMDYFRTQAPYMDDEGLENAMLTLPDPTRAQTAYLNNQNRRDTTTRAEAMKTFEALRKAIANGEADAASASADFAGKYPEYTQHAQMLSSMKRNPNKVTKQGLDEAKTDVTTATFDRMTRMTPIMEKNANLKNQIMQVDKLNKELKLKKAKAGGTTGKKPMTYAQKLSAMRFIAAMKIKVRGTFEENLLMGDDPAYQDSIKAFQELIEDTEQMLMEDDAAAPQANSANPSAPAPKTDQPAGFKPGDKVYDFTKQ